MQITPINNQESQYMAFRRPDVTNHVKATYRIVGSKAHSADFKDAVLRTAMIQSVRTITKAPFETTESRLAMLPIVIELGQEGSTAKLAFPDHLFSKTEGLGHLLSVLVSGVEYNFAGEFWLEDIELPPSFLTRFSGPMEGVQGVREIFQVHDRPLIGVVFKPRAGVSYADCLPAYQKALRGVGGKDGVDVLVDDLLFVNPDSGTDPEMDFSMRSRAKRLVVFAADNGKKYILNLGSNIRQAKRFIDEDLPEILQQPPHAASLAGFMVNAWAMGLDSLEWIRAMLANLKSKHLGFRPILVATNMGVGTSTRHNPAVTSPGIHPPAPAAKNGFSDAVFVMLCRLAGADAIHCGTPESCCFGVDSISLPHGRCHDNLKDSNGRIVKPAMPVAEGDILLNAIWPHVRAMGKNLLIEATNGILSMQCPTLRKASLNAQDTYAPDYGAQAFVQLAEHLTKLLEETDVTDDTAMKSIRKLIGSERYEYWQQHFADIAQSK